MHIILTKYCSVYSAVALIQRISRSTELSGVLYIGFKFQNYIYIINFVPQKNKDTFFVGQPITIAILKYHQFSVSARRTSLLNGCEIHKLKFQLTILGLRIGYLADVPTAQLPGHVLNFVATTLPISTESIM